MKSNITTTTIATIDRGNLELWAESVIDAARFHDGADRVLARYEAVDAMMPSSDEMAAKGIDIVSLAMAIENGLVVSEFKGMAERMNAFTDPTELNAALELFNESAEERAAQPDPVLRSLAAVGVHDVCFA